MGVSWQIVALSAAAAEFLLLALAPQGWALTRINGSYFLNEDYGSGPSGDTNLLQGGVNLSVMPPSKKQLNTLVNLRLDATRTNEKTTWNVSPLGNLAVTVSGESYSVNLQHTRASTVSSQAVLTESAGYQAAASLQLPDLPSLALNYNNIETTTGGIATTSELFSAAGNYNYRWLTARAGYARQNSQSQSSSSDSSAQTLGLAGSYEILPMATISGNYDFSRNLSSYSTGGSSEALANAVRMTAAYTPLQWLSLEGNFSKTVTSFDSATSKESSTDLQQLEATASVFPLSSLRLYGSAGNRSQDGSGQTSDVDYLTLGTGFNKRLSAKVDFAFSASRSLEWDPVKGRNTADSYSLNTMMDLTPRVALRLNLGVTRNENKEFVDTSGFNASGTLADRTLYDDRPAGFSYFDTENNNLYTKKSSSFGDWGPPVHYEPPTKSHYSVNRSLQANLIPTDQSTLYLLYSASSSSDSFEPGKIGSQSVNASYGYQPNARTSYTLSGSGTFPESGASSYSGTAGMAYRFRGGHQMSLSYGRQFASNKSKDSAAGTLDLRLRKRARLSLTASFSDLNQSSITSYLSLRFSKTF